jgi:hypothetical protein
MLFLSSVAQFHTSSDGHYLLRGGKDFFWLGDTWWMGLSRRLHWPEEFRK